MMREAFAAGPGRPATVSFDRSRSYLESVKAFPRNVNIRATLTFRPAEPVSLPSVPDGRYVSVALHYTMAALPDEPMQPRIGDDRVGNFHTVHKDFSQEDTTFFVRYVNRWRLEPGERVGDKWRPRQPITYYIDPNVPEDYRGGFKAGVEAWNAAFEAAGWVGAIRALDLPADADPEDIRFATLRWNVSDQAGYGAIGPSTVDPRTGEVLDADILFEASMFLGFRNAWRTIPGGLGAAEGLEQALGVGAYAPSEGQLAGKGSRFWFTIKLKKENRDESISHTLFNDLRGIRILIVDDNSTNRSILHDQIISWGMSNGSAENGQRALELLTAAAKRGEPYDLAVVDMNMPGMNGIELAEAIKQDPLIASVRMIMLTSVGYFGDYDDALNSGFLSYLTKPVRQSQLYNCLLNVMNEPAEITLQKKSKDDEQDKKSWQYHGAVLLAEDNLVNQEVTRGFLENLGCRVDIVNNGREAVEALKRELYDAVFMDCQMPEMDGFDATRVIREQEKNDNRQHVPIIALTAHAMEGDREECIAAGMDDYLSKPFTHEQLREKLERWIGQELHASPLDQKILENIRGLQKEG